ncbi:fimbrial protein [Burkholderia ubonensis]|uniref:fimbrial protein n=1 Tax=Burkholderia ubonensis TaxID=101571 RepID=UPI0009B3CFB1|nr:fimbrial protein [Burkholderia ubonensis]
MTMNDFRWTRAHRRQLRNRVLRLLASCLLLLTTFSAHAACNLYTDGTVPGRRSITLSGSLNVPRDAAIGTEIGRMTYVLPSRFNFAYCNTATRILIDEVLSSTPHLPPVMDKVYPTGVQGIGVKFTDDGVALPAQLSMTTQSNTTLYLGSNNTYSYVFVVTGPVSGGTIGASDLPTATFLMDGKPYFSVNAVGVVSINALSCKTPDVSVDMGTVRSADLKSVGSTSAPVAFKVEANGCPAGISKITYQFKAPNGVVDPAAGVVALTDDSTAQGIALKLMDESGAALRLDSPYALSVKPGVGSYALPLKAAYYRTSPMISSGSANAILTFTMSYN